MFLTVLQKAGHLQPQHPSYPATSPAQASAPCTSVTVEGDKHYPQPEQALHSEQSEMELERKTDVTVMEVKAGSAALDPCPGRVHPLMPASRPSERGLLRVPGPPRAWQQLQ